MRVLITGGSGHIGGVVRRHLDALGWDVVTVSKTGDIRADLKAEDFVDTVVDAMKSCDAIVHCAASMAKEIYDSNLSMVNGLGTQRVIAVAGRTHARHLVYLSSLPLIGRPMHSPIDEQHPVSPLTAYHASKHYGEHLIRLAAHADLRTVSLRLTSPIGPGTPPGRIFSEFIARAQRDEPLVLVGQGSRRQDYIDVRDIACAVALSISRAGSGVFNIAAGQTVSNLELATRCVSVLKSRSVITYSGTQDPDETLIWRVSIEKARKYLGFDPEYGLDDSIATFAANP